MRRRDSSRAEQGCSSSATKACWPVFPAGSWVGMASGQPRDPLSGGPGARLTRSGILSTVKERNSNDPIENGPAMESADQQRGEYSGHQPRNEIYDVPAEADNDF